MLDNCIKFVCTQYKLTIKLSVKLTVKFGVKVLEITSAYSFNKQNNKET